jgi:hypothetical protein
MPVRRPQRFTSHPGRGALAAERFCARCGARDVPLEKHHWAPRAVFEDADNWPISYLCLACHDDWHRKMGWRPRVKTQARLRTLRESRIRSLLGDFWGAYSGMQHRLQEVTRAIFLASAVGLCDYPYWNDDWRDVLARLGPDKESAFAYIRHLEELCMTEDEALSDAINAMLTTSGWPDKSSDFWIPEE